jgi:hypothetical protein
VFTIEFFRIREGDYAHAMLDRIVYETADLEDAIVRAKTLFETLDMPQMPDGLRIVDESGVEVFAWAPEKRGQH